MSLSTQLEHVKVSDAVEFNSSCFRDIVLVEDQVAVCNVLCKYSSLDESDTPRVKWGRKLARSRLGTSFLSSSAQLEKCYLVLLTFHNCTA